MLTRLLPMALVLTQSPVAPSSAAAQVFQGHALPAWRGLPPSICNILLRCACLSLSVSVVCATYFGAWNCAWCRNSHLNLFDFFFCWLRILGRGTVAVVGQK
ncbi:hypothetical protein M441DRAFT_300403 [Trichoderma asperellum CBS 433.97]|uniref:Secreted protein n=1 Tax=Trichoderma asperellum (strain ATCC 204424 / CBS 433.97 / NBRC 101777) TaxID=1042311 RepID=A0A2T3ZJ88_TRIA4|nr:hypothetical protein M441DRAFT_300403 [Trichoderma asperellum CBS 433.97]PTB44875.1 hypothetical protein M441DRAFT_300403 [Trichoderma asperellum CBS 433.97]